MKTEPNIAAMAEAVAMSAGVKWDAGIYAQWDQGGIELYTAIAELAQISSDLVEDLVIANIDISGVWAYDVSEAFGAEIPAMTNEHRSSFSVEMAKVKLGEIAYRSVCCVGILTDHEHALAYAIINRWTDYVHKLPSGVIATVGESVLHVNETKQYPSIESITCK